MFLKCRQACSSLILYLSNSTKIIISHALDVDDYDDMDIFARGGHALVNWV